MCRIAVVLTLALLAGACKREPTPSPPAPAPEDAEPVSELITVTWPAGDAAAGRAAFIEHRCFSCHLVMMDDELSQMHKAGHGGHEGHGAAPAPAPAADHNLPPPLNAATTNKPGLILAKQTVMPGDSTADHAVHYGAYADKLTVAQLTDLVAFLTQVARSEIAKPERMPADDLDLVWPPGDAAAGRELIASRGCARCHGAKPGPGITPAPALGDAARPALVVVRSIAMPHPAETGPLTLRQLTDIATALGARN